MTNEDAVSSEERVLAAIALEMRDRIPLGHSIDSFAARYAGISQEDWWFNHDRAHEALVKTFRELGPWDTNVSTAPGHPLEFALTAPMRVRLPGRDLAPNEPMQFDEMELMLPEDYDLIIEQGFDVFLQQFFPRLNIDPAIVPDAQAAIARYGAADSQVWQEMGVYALCGTKLRPPYDWFAFARSLRGFMLDLFRRPQKVIDAMDATLPAMLEKTKAHMCGSGSLGVFIPMARGATTFVSPKQFERFCWPWVKKAVHALVDEGFVPVLHCDSDWTPLLHFFRELPARRCILQLDEKTDIFRAKEVLGDHMCLYGNVASALLSLGSVEEVEAHCRHLVDVVGAGGGFILGPACSMPMDARPENVRAMTRAVLEP